MPDDRLPEDISETVSVPLSTEALRHFTDALAAATTAEAAYDALCVLTKATVGAKLFTVMTVDMTAMPFGADETLMALAAQIEIAAPWFARQQRLIDRLAGLA